MAARDRMTSNGADALCGDSVAIAPALVVEPMETLQRLLLGECRGGLKRNSSYLQDLQRDGMLASWRQKMSRWMFETGSAFDMAKDTVGCAIHYMDQYLSTHSVSKPKLQLLSLVSLSVASKMHECQPISMVSLLRCLLGLLPTAPITHLTCLRQDEMKVLCENKFSRKDIWQVEAELMKVMKWNLNPLTPFTFARDLISALAGEDDRVLLLDPLLAFLQDVTEDYTSIRFRSSSVATAAVFIFTKIHQVEVQSAFAKAIASLQLSASELVECFHFLTALHHSKNHFGQPSSVVEVKEIDGFSVASSPCSVDADLCEDLCSPAWAIEFCDLFEAKPRGNDDADDADLCPPCDYQPRTKRMRATEPEAC